MNALTRSVNTLLPRTAVLAQRRMQSATASTVADKASIKLRKVWLSDQGAYPVIATLVFACAFCTWYGLRNLLTSPDIRINRDKRGSVVRTWGFGQWS